MLDGERRGSPAGLLRLREDRRSLDDAVVAIGSQPYHSRFRRWDEHASVRSRPRRLLDRGEPDRLYFPPELTPVARHSLVSARGERLAHALLVHRLYQYLHFTSELEQVAVVPVTVRIARGSAGLPLPEEMRADAYKIATDEAWHAQFSHDLLRQTATATGVTPPPAIRPQFMDRLDAIGRRLEPGLGQLAELLFAVVSETLISRILSDIPHDPRLPGAVRAVVADHAADEGRHHAYFRDFLDLLWPTVDARTRRAIGPWLPEMIYAFLEPDYPATGLALVAEGLSGKEVECVLQESYPRDDVVASIRDAGRSTVQYLVRAGVLDDPRTAEAFEAAGLIVDPRG